MSASGAADRRQPAGPAPSMLCVRPPDTPYFLDPFGDLKGASRFPTGTEPRPPNMSLIEAIRWGLCFLLGGHASLSALATNIIHLRHARPCAGHPRLASGLPTRKTWMTGTSPAMTENIVSRLTVGNQRISPPLPSPSLSLARLRFGSERLVDDAADRLGTARQIRLLAAPVVQAIQKFLIHSNVDLWILRHCYIAISLLVCYQTSESGEWLQHPPDSDPSHGVNPWRRLSTTLSRVARSFQEPPLRFPRPSCRRRSLRPRLRHQWPLRLPRSHPTPSLRRSRRTSALMTSSSPCSTNWRSSSVPHGTRHAASAAPPTDAMPRHARPNGASETSRATRWTGSSHDPADIARRRGGAALRPGSLRAAAHHGGGRAHGAARLDRTGHQRDLGRKS